MHPNLFTNRTPAMSLATLHNPQLALTSSFGGSLRAWNRPKESDLILQSLRKKHAPLSLLNESTPLVNSSSSSAPETSDETADITDKERINLTLLTTILVVTLGSSLQFGYGTGVMNNSEGFILNYFHSHDMAYTLVGWSITVSCYGIGGLLGSIIGPKFIGKYCGRKATLLWNNVFLVTSLYFMICAKAWWYQAIGRVFVGIVVGIATAVVPTYFSELSPISIRGAVGTMH